MTLPPGLREGAGGAPVLSAAERRDFLMAVFLNDGFALSRLPEYRPELGTDLSPRPVPIRSPVRSLLAGFAPRRERSGNRLEIA